MQIPAIQAAIEAGVHYCDLGAIGKYAELALQLDSQARAKGITAIIATGWIAVLNLMAIHAVHQLDEVEQLSVCMLFDYSPESFYSPVQSLARARTSGQIETSWDVMETAGRPLLTYRSGEWARLDPLKNPLQVKHPSGYEVTSYLADLPSILTLPGSIPSVKNVICSLGMIPPQLMELFILKSQQIESSETDWKCAALSFLESAIADQDHWLVIPPGYPKGWWMWDIVSGYKDKRKARYMCWPAMTLNWTMVSLGIVTLRILRGEISQHGVFLPESCLELTSFLDEATRYVRAEARGTTLLNQSFEWQT